MAELQAPEASADATEHADWLELTAVVAADSDSSTQDLVAAIRRTGSIDAVRDSEELDDDEPLDSMVEREDEELERIADAAFAELERRQEHLGDAYPFSINSALTARADAAASPYAFLTALTHFGLQSAVAPEDAASLFERVSAAALVQYLGGAPVQSYPFGFPRREGPKAFHDAINDLCQKMGEGVECKVSRSKAADRKDAKLDVVAWIPFGDGRSNQLSVFGQCTTAKDWVGKINELQPSDFCRRWMRETPAVWPLLAFFVPRQIADAEWDEASIGERRIVFDRLRIASALGGLEEELTRRCAEWTGAVIAEIHA